MSSSPPPAELQQLRARIDDLDAHILALLAQRFEVTAKVVSQHKTAAGQPH